LVFQGNTILEFQITSQPQEYSVPVTLNACSIEDGLFVGAPTLLQVSGCTLPAVYVLGSENMPVTFTNSTFRLMFSSAAGDSQKAEIFFDGCQLSDVSLQGRSDITIRNSNVSGDITVDSAQSQKIIAQASYINKIEAGPGAEFDILEVEADSCTIGEIEIVGFDFAVQPSLTLNRCVIGNITCTVAAGGDLFALTIRDCTVQAVTLSGLDENTLVIDWYPSIASAYQQGTVFTGLPTFNLDYFNVFPVTGEPTFSVEIAASKHTVFDITAVPEGGTVVTLPNSIATGGVPGRLLTFTNSDDSAATGDEITFTGSITPTGGGSIESGGRSTTFLCVFPGSWTVISQSP